METPALTCVWENRAFRKCILFVDCFSGREKEIAVSKQGGLQDGYFFWMQPMWILTFFFLRNNRNTSDGFTATTKILT